jgi:outer membrane receptor for ferrienterochelin and colicins
MDDEHDVPSPGHDGSRWRGVMRVRRRTSARVVLLLLVSAPLGWARAAFAQDDSRQTEEEIEKLDFQALLETPIEVWTATKTVQRSYEAPAVITTVTREQITALGYRSIAELLDHQLGFYVVDDHATANVAVRGSSGGLYADSSIIKVLIDGHSIAFGPTGGNWLGPELIPLSAVDRVEIIRGPASALYGADAFLGLVNIKTRDGKGINGGTGWVAGGIAGNRATTDVDLALGTSRGIVDFMVAYRRNHADLSGLALPASSPKPSLPDYNLDARTAQGLDQDSTAAIARLTLRPGVGTELGAFAYFSGMERGAEFAALYQLAKGIDRGNSVSENRLSQWQLRTGVLLERDVSRLLHLGLRGAYFQGQPRLDNRLEIGSDFYYVRRQYGFRGADLDGNAVWTPRPSLRLVAGAGVLVDDERLPSRIGVAKQPFANLRAGEVIEAVSLRQGHKTFVNAGTYAQGAWEAYPRWLSFTGGLRYDHHNVYGGKLSGRVGLVSSPRADLHVKLLQGSAFKAPSPLLLYAVPSGDGDIIGNAQLKPQEVNTVELQVVYEPSGAFSFSSDVAYSRLDEKTEFVQQGINKIARNVARATTLSWENLAELKLGAWLRAQASVELQRTVQRTGQEGYVGEVIGSPGGIYPNLMLHGNVVVQAPRVPLRLATLVSYIGERRASGNNILLNGGPYTLPAYVLVEANLSTLGFKLLRDPAQEVSFSLSGKNLLGATGPSPGFSGVDFPLPPRAWFLQMTLSL